ELARAEVAEGDSRAHHEILDGARHEHLVGARERADASADIDGHPRDVVSNEFALASVQPGAQLYAQSAHGVRNGPSAADPACGAIERGQKAVAHRLDLAIPVALELGSHEL